MVVEQIPNPIDRRVGQRVRTRRRELAISQGTLSERIGVSYQQLQKYETGTNRLSASRLAALAKELGVPVTYFFEVGSENSRKINFRAIDTKRKSIEVDKIESGLGSDRSANAVDQHQRLLGAYDRIDDQKLRDAFLALLEAVRS